MATKIDDRLSPILSDLLEGGVNPKTLMEAAIALTDLAGEVCTEEQLELLDLDEVQDPIVEFLANIDELEEN